MKNLIDDANILDDENADDLYSNFSIDMAKDVYDIVFGEASGGSDDEVIATADTFLNIADEEGFDKAKRRSSAYTKKSPQYLKARDNKFDSQVDAKDYARIVNIVDSRLPLLYGERLPYNRFENERKFGTHPESKRAIVSKTIGRQKYLQVPTTGLLQIKLKEKGYDPGKVDGIDGPKTRKAVREYQKDHGLTVDGIAGKNTWKDLLSFLNPFHVTEASAEEPNNIPQIDIGGRKIVDDVGIFNNKPEDVIVYNGQKIIDDAGISKKDGSYIFQMPTWYGIPIDKTPSRIDSMKEVKMPIKTRGVRTKWYVRDKNEDHKDVIERQPNILKVPKDSLLGKAIGGYEKFTKTRVGQELTSEETAQRVTDIVSLVTIGSLGIDALRALAQSPVGQSFINRVVNSPLSHRLFNRQVSGDQMQRIFLKTQSSKYGDMTKDEEKIWEIFKNASKFLPRSKASQFGITITPNGSTFVNYPRLPAPGRTSDVIHFYAGMPFVPEKSPLKSNLQALATWKLPNTFVATQAINTLRKGISPEELEFSGVEEWLKSKGKATKDELIDYLEKNKVKIEETVKGDREVAEAKRKELGVPSGEEVDVGSPKYSKYTLPGGEYYQETLLRLPNTSNQPTKKDYDDFRNFLSDKYAKNGQPGFRVGELTEYEKRHLFELSKAQKEIKQYYQSSHWDEPNVIVHHRTNRRTNTKGQQGTFIEEIQSDWHQEGKKKGYKGHGSKYLAQIENPEARKIAMRMINAPSEKLLSGEFEGELSRLEELEPKINHDQLYDINAYGVPNAPFKKSWHELALKDIIQKAVARGDKFVAWISGEQTADRYDLSKQIDSISWSTLYGDRFIRLKGLSGISGQDIVIVSRNGKIWNVYMGGVQDWVGKDISDVLGKDIASKIDDNNTGDLVGNDLKVGGEWAKNFYDKILPNTVNKYIKKWGGKVEEIFVDMSSLQKRPIKLGVSKQQGFYITPQMVKEVSQVGQPMFGTRLAGNILDTLKNERGTLGAESTEPLPDDYEGKPEIFNEIEKERRDVNKKNIEGIQSSKQVGKESGRAVQEPSDSGETTKTGGVLQTQKEVKNKPTKINSEKKSFSKHYERIKKEFGFSDLGEGYTPIKIKNELKKAFNYSQRNPDKALRIAYDLEDAPKTINSQAIRQSVIVSLKESGQVDKAEDIARIASSKFTEAGQTLNLAKLDLSPKGKTEVMNTITTARMERIGSKLGEVDPAKAKEKAKKEVVRISKKSIKSVTSEQKDIAIKNIKDIDKLIDGILCK